MAIDRTLSLLVKFAALDRMTAPMKRIGLGSRDAGKAIGATRRELAALERTQARIGKMKALETRLKADTAALDGARAKMAALKEQIAATESPTKKLTSSLAKAEREVVRLEAAVDGQGTELQQLSTRLGAAGIDVAQLGTAEDRLGLNIRATNQRLREQQGELAKTRAAKERFEKTKALGENVRGAGYSAVGAGVAIGAPLAASVNPYRDFQSGLTDIAQKADLSRAKAKLLGDQLLTLGPKVGQLPSALETGVDDLLGKGLGVDSAMKLISPIGRAATAYKAEIADLSSAAYAGLDNLKVPAADAAKMFDVMATAGKAGSFEIKDMATYFPMLTASAQALGQRGVPAVADLAAALQIARKGTGDASTAANNLQNLMNKINTKDTIANFKGFGIDLAKELKVAEAAGKSPIEAIAELSNKALGGDMSKLSFLFGDAQVQAALRPLVGNLELYRKIRADALAANGTVERDFLERTKDDATRAAIATVRMSAAMIKLGSILSPVITDIQERVGLLADSFLRFSIEHPTITKGAILLTGGLAGLLVVCGTLAIASGTLITTFAYFARSIGTVWTVLRVGFGLLTGLAAIIGWPFTLLAIAIGAAVIFVWAKWDAIKAAFTGAWTWLKGLDFTAIGKNMLLGLINGLNPLTLVRHILSLGTKAITALKGILGIKSPSRVFAGIGGFITEGLTLGIDRGATGPVNRIRGLARNVAAAGVLSAMPVTAAATPGLTAASIPKLGSGAQGGTAAAGNREYHLHLNLPAGAAQDAETFARAVLEQIKRLERADQRSSYRDD
jgi:TP901 family phage tail tape measure protein